MSTLIVPIFQWGPGSPTPSGIADFEFYPNPASKPWPRGTVAYGSLDGAPATTLTPFGKDAFDFHYEGLAVGTHTWSGYVQATGYDPTPQTVTWEIVAA